MTSRSSVLGRSENDLKIDISPYCVLIKHGVPPAQDPKEVNEYLAKVLAKLRNTHPAYHFRLVTSARNGIYALFIDATYETIRYCSDCHTDCGEPDKGNTSHDCDAANCHGCRYPHRYSVSSIALREEKLCVMENPDTKKKVRFLNPAPDGERVYITCIPRDGRTEKVLNQLHGIIRKALVGSFAQKTARRVSGVFFGNDEVIKYYDLV